MRREADSEYVKLIIGYLGPLKNPHPDYGNPQEYVACEVQLAMDRLRYLPRKYQSEADRNQLVSLLRQFEYNELADEVKRKGSYTVSPPPRSNVKYYCAIQAAHLMDDFSEKKLTKRGAFHEITSLLYGALSGGKEENCESACKQVIEWLKEPTTKREFTTRLEELEREWESLLASYPEGPPSHDIAIQASDLRDHFLKSLTQAAELHAAQKRPIEKAIRAIDAKFVGALDCMRTLEKAVDLFKDGKKQWGKEFRKAFALFAAWKKKYPKEALGDEMELKIREMLDLSTAIQASRLKPRDAGPPMPPKKGEIK
jgi:hypothetical protein